MPQGALGRMLAMAGSSGLDWGTVPAWIASVSTFLAFVGAAWAAYSAGGQLRLLRSEASERSEEQKRFQAAHVTAWLDKRVNGEWVAMFVNKSGLPVVHVTVGFVSPNNDNTFMFPVLAPTDEPADLRVVTLMVQDTARRNPNIGMAWVAPSDTKVPVKSLVAQDDGSQRWEPTAMTGPLGLTITFTDTEGRRWHRDLRGALTEVDAGYNLERGGIVVGDDWT